MSKKLVSYAPIAIAASYLLPALALAQSNGSPNPSAVNSIVNNVTAAARLIVTLLFVLALLVFVWGAVKLILAAGNPEAIGKAKSFMWWGIIAMAVLASVFGLVTFLQTYFGVEGGGGFRPITIPPNITGQ